MNASLNNTLVNRWIGSLPDYVAGKARIKGVTDPIRLAANESALGTSPRAKAAVAAAENLSRYPTGDGEMLRAALAKKYGINQEQIICGNGSDELISMIASGWGGVGKNAVVSEYGFLYYPIACAAVGCHIRKVAMKDGMVADAAAMAAACDEATSILFLANPNNPTGTFLSAAELKRLCETTPPHVLIVIDSAYAEYAEAEETYESGIALVNEFANVVMLRTFSKIYGLAALRVGWAYSALGNIRLLNKLRAPFNLNAVGPAAAAAALKDETFTRKVRNYTVRRRQKLGEELAELGAKTYPSAANFLMVEGNYGNALERENILVRSLAPMGLPNHFRVSIGNEAEMERFLAAFSAVIKR